MFIELQVPPEPPIGTILRSMDGRVEYHHREDGWYYVNLDVRYNVAGELDIEGRVSDPQRAPKYRDYETEWEWIIRNFQKLEVISEES